ncbi:MAG TPA: malic enzyme-like NAD(P)-binding protein [Micromonosporaceae bacterium]|nr:malic enzyme-like NAD(P)-binding protein [Micromonosporaceae bacterium]
MKAAWPVLSSLDVDAAVGAPRAREAGATSEAPVSAPAGPPPGGALPAQPIDDIQGTAAAVVAGILAALRRRRERLSDQRIVVVGAGAAGIGIARLLRTAVRAEGGSEHTVHRVVVMLDPQGLVFDGREGVEDDQRPFAMPGRELVRLGFASAGRYDLMRLGIAGVGPYDLETVVRHVHPTVLVGTTGVPGVFTEAVIREMAARVPRPIVLPPSNPAARCGAASPDVLAWTGWAGGGGYR